MLSLLYTRISDDPTGGEAGVERQLSTCRKLSKKLGAEVAESFSDNDISAYSGKVRPNFEKLLVAMASGKYDVLICWHVDRLYRSLKDLERIIEAAEAGNVKIQTVNSGDLDLSTSAGRMIARILGSVSRQESEHHAERRREANLTRALSGEWRKEGSRPFGYDKTGTPLEPEASMVRQAVRDILGGKSLHAVAREWNASGVTTVRGVTWTNLHVRRVLTNPRIAALRVHRGQTVGTGTWTPIVDEALWRGLTAFLSDPSRKNAVAFERKFIGSGVYICGHRTPDADPDDPDSICGRRLYAAHPHGRNRAMAYCCRPVVHLGRNGRELDLHVQTYAFGELQKIGVGGDLRKPDQIDIGAIRTERDALQATKDELATLLRKRILDMAGVEREAAILNAQIADLNAQMATAAQASPITLLLEDGEDPEALADEEKLRQRWLASSPDIRGKIISMICDVVVLPAHGKRVFDSNDVEFRAKNRPTAE